MKKSINVGICGLGTVGAGTAKMLQENVSLIKKRTGLDIQVTRVATIDPYDHLDIDFSEIKVTNSVEDILNDQEIDIVVELIGGTGIAKKVVLDAFRKNKSVVTANKALIAKNSEEIFSSAYQSKGLFGFEASVGGGIPIIRSIKEGFSGDKIEAISGIMNGTANYVLSSMTEEKADFESALKVAQEKGYAEADPTFDIEGIDTAHKVIILMELAFNALFEFDQMYIEGISGIESADIELASELGYRVKLLGKALNTNQGFEGRVHPALVKKGSLLAAVHGPFNAITVRGNFVGDTMSYGAGAGSYPTASAVVGNIIEISRHLSICSLKQVLPLSVAFDKLEKKEILPIDRIESEYYLRFSVNQLDNYEQIRTTMETNNIAVSSVKKVGKSESINDTNTIVVLTETVEERTIQNTLKAINNLPFIAGPTKLIRIDS